MLHAILDTYNQRKEKGLIEDPYPEPSDHFLDFLKHCDITQITTAMKLCSDHCGGGTHKKHHSHVNKMREE